jgi:transposase-like protein
MRIWSLQDSPERQDALAEMLANGDSRATIAEAFGINVDTVTEWRKRPEIAARVKKINDDRAQRIVSLTDAKLIARLEGPKAGEIPTETLLKIRQTVGGTLVKTEQTGDAAAAAAELFQAAHDDPELAEALRKLQEAGAGSD